MRIDTSAVTSHFPNPQDGFTTTTSGSVSSNASTIGLNSIGDYSNGDVVALIIEPADADKKQVFVGIIDISGVQVTNVVWVGGVNQSHASGATVVDYYDAAHIKMMTKGILVHADLDGTLKAGAVDNASVVTDGVISTSKLADSAITTVKIADDAVTAAKVDWASTGANGGIWWEELGRTTLSGPGDTVSVASFSARRYLRVYVHLIATGGTIGATMTFNNDTGSNYARRASNNGGAEATQASGSNVITIGAGSNDLYLAVDIENFISAEKPVNYVNVQNGGAGAANIPARNVGVGKWANTVAQITRIDVTNGGTGDYAIGSEVVVLGHD